ncbi:MAG: CBS domain-containing protein [Chloroflexi bacterium]|nr:CBS domain-containing protein [Chloroflexota bacterium]
MKNTLVKDWMVTNVITAGPHTGMLDAHKLMRDHNIRRLPIVKKNNQLVGIVTRSDIRKAEPSEATTLNVWEMNYLLSKLQLKDIMTKNVLTAHVNDSLKSVALKMQENKIGALPVVDDHNKVVGIITESDIFRALIAWFNEEEAAAAAA